MLKVYYDGVNRVEKQGKSLPLKWSDWRVGKRFEVTTDNQAFHGTIDQIRIYNRALSPEEITALYKLQK